MNTMELESETKKLLDRVRHRSKVLSLYEMPADLAEAAVWELGRAILENQQLPLVQYNQYRWYLRELARLLRQYTGWDLALELEIALRKWVAYRMDPLLLQALLLECHERIAAMTPEEVEEGRTAKNAKSAKYAESQPKSEVRMQNSEVGSVDSCIGPNDERCTMNEVTTTGSGNG